MSIINLKVRYFQDSTPLDVPCREENFIRRDLAMSLPAEQTALVIVDVWDNRHIKSWFERAEAVTKNVIVPVIETARKAGITVIHAPSPETYEIAPQAFNVYQGNTTPPAELKFTWPPQDFRQRTGQYAIYRGPRLQPPGVQHQTERIPAYPGPSPNIKIDDSDFAILNRWQLHDLCEERKILHLLYVGFATNWCILGRDYGIRTMSQANRYNTILIRDATLGIEFPDTLEKAWATELAVREAEQVHGFTTSNEDFFTACKNIDKE